MCALKSALSLLNAVTPTCRHRGRLPRKKTRDWDAYKKRHSSSHSDPVKLSLPRARCYCLLSRWRRPPLPPLLHPRVSVRTRGRPPPRPVRAPPASRALDGRPRPDAPERLLVRRAVVHPGRPDARRAHDGDRGCARAAHAERARRDGLPRDHRGPARGLVRANEPGRRPGRRAPGRVGLRRARPPGEAQAQAAHGGGAGEGEDGHLRGRIRARRVQGSATAAPQTPPQRLRLRRPGLLPAAPARLDRVLRRRRPVLRLLRRRRPRREQRQTRVPRQPRRPRGPPVRRGRGHGDEAAPLASARGGFETGRGGGDRAVREQVSRSARVGVRGRGGGGVRGSFREGGARRGEKEGHVIRGGVVCDGLEREPPWGFFGGGGGVRGGGGGGVRGGGGGGVRGGGGGGGGFGGGDPCRRRRRFGRRDVAAPRGGVPFGIVASASPGARSSSLTGEPPSPPPTPPPSPPSPPPPPPRRPPPAARTTRVPPGASGTTRC